MKRILCVIILILMLVSASACGAAEQAYEEPVTRSTAGSSYSDDADAEFIDLQVIDAPVETPAPEEDPSYFEIHFIDVGQGDSELIICDGYSLLIDGGNSQCSSLMYTYLEELGIEYLDYVVNTHPDGDHVGGLSGALHYACAGRVFCSVRDYDDEFFNNFLSCVSQQDLKLEIPSPGLTLPLGSAEIEFIGPVFDATDLNNGSVVLKVTYGNTSFLFTGDASQPAEAALLDSGADVSCDVLKVSHHGSRGATTSEFLEATGADYAVISCGACNSFGHPSDETLNRLKAADVKLYRTDICGDIICSSDGEVISFATGKHSPTDCYSTYHDLYGDSFLDPASMDEQKVIDGGNELTMLSPEELEEMEAKEESARLKALEAQNPDLLFDFILNGNSMVFHLPTCPSVAKMKDENKVPFKGTREQFLELYPKATPCGNCKP